MCRYQHPEEAEEDECSIRNILGADHQCKQETVNACIALIEAYSGRVDPELVKKTQFSNEGEINDKCFGKFVLFTDLPKPCH